MRTLTTSELKTKRRCSREHHLSYELGYRAVTQSDAARFGTLVHLGLEAWWLAPADRLEAALAAVDQAEPIERARARVALIGYDCLWGAEPYDVLAVEEEFRAPLINPATGRASRTFMLGGKLDVRVRHRPTGDVLVVEHKTSSEDTSAGSDYWRRLLIDTQVSTYLAGATANGHPVQGVLYDVLGKPALRPSLVPLTDELGCKIVLAPTGERVRTAKGTWRQTGDTALGYVLQTRPETPDEFEQRLADHVAENPARYYQRGTVVRLEQEAVDAAHDAWAQARDIAESALTGRWPRNADACVRYGYTCAFFDVCTGVASIDDPVRFRRTANVHEELTPDAPAPQPSTEGFSL